MATVAAVHTWAMKGVLESTWTFASGVFASGDTGTPLDAPNLPDKTLYVNGPTGGTSSVTIQGSYAASGPWFTVNAATPTGSTLAITNGGVYQLLENPMFVRPLIDTVTAADPVTWTVHITSRSSVR